MSFYFPFKMRGAPLMVEETPVDKSFIFSRTKLRCCTAVDLTNGFQQTTFADEVGCAVSGGRPLISYIHCIAAVWKHSDEVSVEDQDLSLLSYSRQKLSATMYIIRRSFIVPHSGGACKCHITGTAFGWRGKHTHTHYYASSAGRYFHFMI